MSQQRFGWTLIKQSILQKKGKAILLIVAAAMGASVVAALLNLDVDLRSRMNRELRDYGPNVILSPQSGSLLPASVAADLNSHRAEYGIVSMTPELLAPVRIQDQPTLLVGANLGELQKLYPGWKWQRTSSPGGAFVGVRLAKRLSLRAQHDIQFSLAGKEVQIAFSGLVESGDAEDDQIFLPIEKLANLTGSGNDVHLIALSALGDIQQVQNNMDRFASRNPGVKIQVLRKIAVAETLILDRLSGIMTWVIVIIFAILFFCINTTVTAILLSRQSEIALLRVLGARRRQIVTGLTSELLILGLIGGVGGFVIGIIMAQVLGRILFQTFIVPRFSIFLLTIFSSVAIMLVSSLLPLRRAVERQPALVLKEA